MEYLNLKLYKCQPFELLQEHFFNIQALIEGCPQTLKNLATSLLGVM